MEYKDIDSKTRKAFGKLLDEHLETAGREIEKTKQFLPMLITCGARPESNKMFVLSSADKAVDSDLAYKKALRILKAAQFDTAIFSYTTKFGTDKPKPALKAVLFGGDGVAATVFVTYRLSGLLKRSIDFGEPVYKDVVENALA